MSKVVIIGSGIAGLFAALRLDKAGHQVIIITKQRPEDSSTNWAQGGIAGILDKTDGEGMESHISDSLSCGDGLCNEKMASLKGLLDAYGQPLEAGLDSIAAACADKSGMVSGSALVC